MTFFLPPRTAAPEAADGKVLSADDAELVKKLTGVDVPPTSVRAIMWR